MKIEVLHPGLLAVIPVLFLFFAGSTLYFKKKNHNPFFRSMLFHSVAGCLLILALSGLRIKWDSKAVTTVYVADLSDSTKNGRDNIEGFIKASIQQMPEDQYAGIVTFGSDTKLEQFVSDKKLFHKFETVPLGAGTNMEEAVSVALALLKEDTAKRIVLLTDGQENAGSLENMASSVLSGHVDFKAVRIEKADNSEAYVNNLEVPSKINIGDPFSVKIEVMSNRNMGAVLYLYSGQTLKAQQKVELRTGSNQFLFQDVQEEGGLKTYRVVLDADDDTESVNNEYSAYTDIQSPPLILLVEGRTGASGEFVKLLDRVNVNYRVVTSQAVPETMDGMLEYKSIILIDVYGGDLKEGFINNLESYVKDYGGGFIAIGGENSFALGNYKDTPLEKVLPVYMDLKGEKEIPPLSFLLVIDKSGSMSDGNGHVTNLDLAKEAARKALENLRGTDRIGILSFDDSFTWTNELAPAVDKEEITKNIMGISPGGGTDIYPALKEAVNELKADTAKLKHIILLTDGQDGSSNYEDVIKEMSGSKITLSTVSVGSDADVVLLKSLAEKGSGRYFHTDIGTDIPRIFAQEVFLSVRSYLVNREFIPIAAGNHEILDPVIREGLPAMYGYIASTKKEYAQALLLSDDKEPVLTVWQYGLGRTAAFNSDVENIWTRDFAGWAGYGELWKNVIDYTVRDTNGAGKNVRVEERGGVAEIIYETDEYHGNTSVSAVYTYEDGSSGELTLTPKSPGVYTGEFQAEQTGVYSVHVRQEEDGEVTGSRNTAYVMQYSKEYRFTEDVFVLEHFVEVVKGSFITQPEEVFSGKIDTVRTRFALTTPCLLAALFVFLADVLQRRLRLKLGLKTKLEKGFNSFRENKQRMDSEKKRREEQARLKVGVLKKAVSKSGENSRRKAKPQAVLEEEEKTAVFSSKESISEGRGEEEKQNGMLDTKALLGRKKEREVRQQ